MTSTNLLRRTRMSAFRLAAITALTFAPGGLAQPVPPPLDPAIAAAIKAAPSQGNIFSIPGQATFAGQVLKADTITFASNSQLELTNLQVPWIAIVARRLQIAAPEERFTIVSAAGDVIPPAAAVLLPRPPASAGNSGSPTNPGGTGANGSQGQRGVNGALGKSGPVIYLIANDVLTQPNAPRPTYIDMMVSARGSDGGAGGNGQPGQRGGVGGSGGPSRWNGISCDGGAGNGGKGGDGGRGGDGGDAGRGGNGSQIVLGGPGAVLEILSFGRFNLLPGKAGAPGSGASGGLGGSGGPRGAHTGNCGGGNPGKSGSAGNRGFSGTAAMPGTKGIIRTVSVDADTLF